MSQVVEHLPSTCEALISNLNAAKKREDVTDSVCQVLISLCRRDCGVVSSDVISFKVVGEGTIEKVTYSKGLKKTSKKCTM
jgi:hypothetical protein